MTTDTLLVVFFVIMSAFCGWYTYATTELAIEIVYGALAVAFAALACTLWALVWKEQAEKEKA